jgi:N-methylhydantoinase A/oxoprolinase/acetone carboxylase beta subunit
VRPTSASAAALLDAGVDGIVVSLLFSYRNAEHELPVAILAEQRRPAR